MINTNPMFRTRLAAAALAILAAAAPAALAQPTSSNGAVETSAQLKEEMQFARSLSRVFKHVAREVEPAVVHITQLTNVQQVRRDWFGRPIEYGPTTLRPSGQGSGVIVSADGLILTNNHVIRGADQIKVKTSDGRELEARLIGRDELTDLAVIKIDGKNLRYVEFASSDTVEVGEWVIAIGSPFGFENSVTTGIVSAKGRSLTPREGLQYQDFIQTDAAINPGNSGGPLLNLEGKLVGINSAIATRTGAFEGIGFAIPSDMVRSVMDNLIKNKRVIRGYLGVILEDAAGPRSEEPGVIVRTVEEGTPAARAGFQPGDVIRRFQGRALNEARLRTAIALTPPGTRTTFEIEREGKPMELVVALGDYEAAFRDSLGANFEDFTPQQAQRMGYREGVSGAIIVEIEPNSRAARSGLRLGDIIVQIDGLNVENAEQLTNALASRDYSRGVRLGVIRDRMQGYIDITN